jgi:uncharacterized protein
MITLNVKPLYGILDRSKGLIFTTTPQSVLINTRIGIHTFGMKFALDILILDKHYKIVKLKKNIKPNRIFLWNPLHKTVIELPPGDIQKNNLKIGDTLKIIKNY